MGATYHNGKYYGGSVPIDDTGTSEEKTWSSEKIDTEIDDRIAGAMSHVGMIIHSTTLNTQAKVKAVYGGTTWIQHSGYFLRGMSSGVTANSAIANGGSDDAVVVSHTHSIGYKTGESSTTAALSTAYGTLNTAVNGNYTSTAGESGTNKNIPRYKSVYIWERTA